MLRRFLVNYIARHRNRGNQVFHLVGVPLTFIVSTVFLVRHDWWLALGCFLGGYALQFIGHAIEGNDAGEVVLVKKLLGKPYVEFGPDPGDSQPPSESDE
jgi:hypothetical protein